jgi:MFS family permease
MSQAGRHLAARPTPILHGPFGLLWAGQTVSLLGDGVFTVAFTWQIAVQWHQPALLGLLFGVRVLVELAAVGLCGWIIDRIPRRTTMLAADTARSLLLFAIAGALHQPTPTLRLAMLIAMFGVATALFRPALLAYLPEIVKSDRLASANSMFALSNQVSNIIGPAVGATLVGLGSAPVALRLDAVSFAVAALATLPLPAPRPRLTITASRLGGAGGAAGNGGGSGDDGHDGMFAEAFEGFRAARRVGWVGGTILLFSLTNLATITAERLALPAAAQQRYGHLGGYGAIVVAISVGAVAAAAATGRIRPAREHGRLAYGGVLVFGVAMTGFGIGHGIAAAVLTGLVFGFGQQLCELLWTTGLQQNTPQRLLGRINAVDYFGSFLFLPVSFAFGGAALQALSPDRVLAGAGAVAMLAAVIGLATPALHRWRPFGVAPGADAEPDPYAAANSSEQVLSR